MAVSGRKLIDDLQRASDLHLDIRGSVATVTVDRLAENNRLTPSSLAHLREIAAKLESDRGIHCVVITGAGTEYFSSGIFNIELRTAYSKQDALEIVQLANQAFDAVESLPQVVIGALNGAVRAGGGELALACDFRLCSNNATLAFHEASYACFPGAGAPVRLPEIIGAGRALEIMITGRVLEAEEMLRLGLVTRVVDQSQLTAHVQSLASEIAGKGPLGVRGAKRIVQTRAHSQAKAAHQLSWELRTSLEFSSDVDEAISAHLAQREPKFVGR